MGQEMSLLQVLLSIYPQQKMKTPTLSYLVSDSPPVTAPCGGGGDANLDQ